MTTTPDFPGDNPNVTLVLDKAEAQDLFTLVRTELEAITQERDPDDADYGERLESVYAKLSGRRRGT